MDELIDIVDTDDHELGFTKLKSEAHRDGDWHRGAHVWIVGDGKILLEKRAKTKVVFPDRFDVACAGHVKSGDDYVGTAVRELEEELGLKVKSKDLIPLGKTNRVSADKGRAIRSREVIGIFLLFLKEDVEKLRPCEEEISEVRLFSVPELRKLLDSKPEMFVNQRDYFLDTIAKIEKML